jgi:hypothetical protein
VDLGTKAVGHLVSLCNRVAGAAPFFMSERAIDKLRNRKTKPATYNLDLNLIGELYPLHGFVLL